MPLGKIPTSVTSANIGKTCLGASCIGMFQTWNSKVVMLLLLFRNSFCPPRWAVSDPLTTPFVNIQRILQHLKGGKSCQETRLQSQVLKQSRTIGFLTASIETFLPCFLLDWIGLKLRNGWTLLSWRVGYWCIQVGMQEYRKLLCTTVSSTQWGNQLYELRIEQIYLYIYIWIYYMHNAAMLEDSFPHSLLSMLLHQSARSWVYVNPLH